MKGLHRRTNRCHGLGYLSIKRAVFILLLTGVGAHSFAQTSKKERQVSSLSNVKYDIQPLTIGDQVPEIQFENILNYKNRNVKLSDFKGKLIILDMWSVSCASCIAAFPKMEALQKTFEDKIQILLVNPHVSKYNTEESIKSTLSRLKDRTGFYPKLPVPIHDSILNSYFPHQSVPHVIWIDGSGSVIAITGALEVTEENIRGILEGKKVNFPLKDDWAFDKNKPLLIDDNGGDSDEFVYRSIFTGYKGGIGVSMGTRQNENNETIGYYILNYPLRRFVEIAYAAKMDNFPMNRIIFEVHNSKISSAESGPGNTFCYDVSFPATAFKHIDFNEFLQDDLKKLFNVTVRVEKRKMKCLVIGASDKTATLRTKYSKPEMDLDNTSVRKFIRNYSIDEMLGFLAGNVDKPLINETFLVYNIDIDFPANFDLSDSSQVLYHLEASGLMIKEEEREIEVIIVSDSR